MKLNVNGEEKTVKDNPSMPLLWVLRDGFELTGTKFGCGVGICGACTVHVDGQAIRSCITPLAAVEGKEIHTIEGLATSDATRSISLHVVQQAFVDEQVPQCGWCMSGQIMTAAAFLKENPAPNSDEIVEAMGQNYCRCGCYTRIFAAVAKAAEETSSQSSLENAS
jgi:isoquinoline 1-oxidoreductase alpha subunit